MRVAAREGEVGVAEDGEVVTAVAELAAELVLPEDGAFCADVAAVGEPGDVGVSGGGGKGWLVSVVWWGRG